MKFIDDMRDPRVNRMIGYVIFFVSLVFFGACAVLTEVWGGMLSMVLLIIGGVLFAVSTAWMIKKVRCPHCGQLLHLKLYDISRCPYCKRSTDPNDISGGEMIDKITGRSDNDRR